VLTSPHTIILGSAVSSMLIARRMLCESQLREYGWARSSFRFAPCGEGWHLAPWAEVEAVIQHLGDFVFHNSSLSARCKIVGIPFEQNQEYLRHSKSIEI
jgi:hypothetical protein